MQLLNMKLLRWVVDEDIFYPVTISRSRSTRVSFWLYCTNSTISSRILKFWSPRWPINFLFNSGDFKRGLFFRLWCMTELTVELVQYCLACQLVRSSRWRVSLFHSKSFSGGDLTAGLTTFCLRPSLQRMTYSPQHDLPKPPSIVVGKDTRHQGHAHLSLWVVQCARTISMDVYSLLFVRPCAFQRMWFGTERSFTIACGHCLLL